MSEPIRLHPSPDVALAAWRFEAESEGPQAFHDVALMLGEDAGTECLATLDGKHTETVRGGYRVVCWPCRAVLRFWSCDCQDATYRERACRHVQRAVSLLAQERAASRKGSPP